MKYNAATLEKLEKLLVASGYVVRYEKGNFKSGYCVLQDRQVVVISKFFDTEARIQCLLDLIPGLNLPLENLDPAMEAFGRQVIQSNMVQ